MQKRHKLLILSLLLLVCGSVFPGIGYGSRNLGSTLAGLLFYGGFFMFIAGIVTFVKSLNTKD